MVVDKTLDIPTVDDPCNVDLAPIHEAALAVTSELSLPKVLQKIVHLARALVHAEYAALGVPGPDGSLEQFLVSGKDEADVSHVTQWPTGEGFLRDIAELGRSLRLQDMKEYAQTIGFSSTHSHVNSFLGVPIIARGRIMGMLYLADKIGADEFCQADKQALEMLAAYAAVAIQNAKLYQQVQRLAVLEERERIGMDLHDGIIQSIFAVGLTLEHGAMLLDEAERTPVEARERIQGAIDGLNQIIRDIRNYILDLRPQRMLPYDLVGSLRRVVEEFRANTLVDITLDIPATIGDDLGEATSTALFLIVQEALANAAKHAEASALSVQVRRLDRGHVTLTVQDNGTGFDARDTETVIGHGLSNMQLRAHAVGGRLHIWSAPNEGATVTATLPITTS